MQSPTLQIGNRSIGAGSPCFIVAEVALAHDGSLGSAHAFIDLAAATGVDAVKFQTHIATSESSPMEQFRVPLSSQDRTRFDYWVRTAFTEEQWIGLRDHARATARILQLTVLNCSRRPSRTNWDARVEDTVRRGNKSTPP